MAKITLEKRQILSLVRAYGDKDHEEFKKKVFDIAKTFDENNDYELSEYLMAQVGHSAWSIND